MIEREKGPIEKAVANSIEAWRQDKAWIAIVVALAISAAGGLLVYYLAQQAWK